MVVYFYDQKGNLLSKETKENIYQKVGNEMIDSILDE
jgi:hypothetical protein